MKWMDEDKYVWAVLALTLAFFIFQGVRFLINWFLK
jgi:hypothetical protein